MFKTKKEVIEKLKQNENFVIKCANETVRDAILIWWKEDKGNEVTDTPSDLFVYINDGGRMDSWFLDDEDIVIISGELFLALPYETEDLITGNCNLAEGKHAKQPKAMG